jgi:hypothetical protein
MMCVNGAKVVASFFMANTVPAGEFGWPDFKLFLRRYRSRFERRWPGVPAFWVKELTTTGTPHLHLVVLWLSSPPVLSEFRKWNDSAWAGVVHSSHPRHRDVGCRVDLVRSYVGSASYLSGYLTQRRKVVGEAEGECQRQSDTGKMWGIIGKSHLPISWESDTVSAAQGLQLTRIMRRWRERKGTFFLHSKSSHDSRRSQGKPVEWRRVRAAPSAAVGVPELIEFYRGLGARVRRCRPRLFRRMTRSLWSVDERSRKWEKHGDEIHSACSGWHFINVADFGEVMRFVKGVRSPASLTSCEKRWLNGSAASMRQVRNVRPHRENLAGRQSSRGSAECNREDLHGLHECWWFDAPPAVEPHSS